MKLKPTLALASIIGAMTAMNVCAAEFKFKVISTSSLPSKGILRVSKVDNSTENVLVSLTDEVEADLQSFSKGNIICVTGSVIPETTSVLVRAVKDCPLN